MKISLGLYPDRAPAELLATARLADELGFSTLWIPDSHLLWREVHTMLGAIAASTRSLRLATAVTNPLTRHPTVTVSALATLDELSGGRATLGISVGDSALRTMNLEIARIATLEETIVKCRALFAGEAVSFAQGEGARLYFPPRAVPIYVASTGPNMLRLAGRVADGVILMNGVAPELIGAALDLVREGEREAGRPPGSVKAVVWAACHPSRDAVKYNVARAILRKIPGPVDERTRAIAAEVKRAYDYDQHGSAEAKFGALIPDDLVERYAFAGEPEAIAAQIDRLAELDVDEVALAIPSAQGIAPRDDVVRQLAATLISGRSLHRAAAR